MILRNTAKWSELPKIPIKLEKLKKIEKIIKQNKYVELRFEACGKNIYAF